jgi:thiamine kinase-like enzyme
MASALTTIVPDSILKSPTNAKLAKTTSSYPQAQILHANSTISTVNKWYHKNARNVSKPISLTTKDHAQLCHMDAKSPTPKPFFAQFA